MDFDFPKIFSEQFEHDMAPWLTEKSESGLEALLDIRKLLVKNTQIEKELLKNLNSSLFYAICQMTTIYGFSVGFGKSVMDANLIFDKLDIGFEELRHNYGMLEKTSEQIENERQNKNEILYRAFISRINVFLELPRFPGRTYLQALLDENTQYLDEESINGHILKKIEQEAYKAANNEITWEDFVKEASIEMNHFKKWIEPKRIKRDLVYISPSETFNAAPLSTIERLILRAEHRGDKIFKIQTVDGFTIYERFYQNKSDGTNEIIIKHYLKDDELTPKEAIIAMLNNEVLIDYEHAPNVASYRWNGNNFIIYGSSFQERVEILHSFSGLHHLVVNEKLDIDIG